MDGPTESQKTRHQEFPNSQSRKIRKTTDSNDIRESNHDGVVGLDSHVVQEVSAKDQGPKVIMMKWIAKYNRGPAVDHILKTSEKKLAPVISGSEETAGYVYLASVTTIKANSSISIRPDPNIENTYYLDHSNAICNMFTKKSFCMGYFSGNVREAMCQIMSDCGAVEIQLHSLVKVYPDYQNCYDRMRKSSTKLYASIQNPSIMNHNLCEFSKETFKQFRTSCHQVIEKNGHTNVKVQHFKKNFATKSVSVPIELKKNK